MCSYVVALVALFTLVSLLLGILFLSACPHLRFKFLRRLSFVLQQVEKLFRVPPLQPKEVSQQCGLKEDQFQQKQPMGKS